MKLRETRHGFIYKDTVLSPKSALYGLLEERARLKRAAKSPETKERIAGLTAQIDAMYAETQAAFKQYYPNFKPYPETGDENTGQ